LYHLTVSIVLYAMMNFNEWEGKIFQTRLSF
jgi:hypothetical protein